jgi:hypothetical protein
MNERSSFESAPDDVKRKIARRLNKTLGPALKECHRTESVAPLDPTNLFSRASREARKIMRERKSEEENNKPEK